MVVIGSANSSNTVSLAKVADAEGCRRVLRIDRAAELPDDLSGTIAVTAGASAPEWLVEEVLDQLAPRHGIEVVDVTVEEEYFPPPPELRELLRCTALAAEVALAAGSHPSPLADDRSVPASRMLAAS
jgi:4-hydroxy-3-methylbut-2-en-1-yl diphosphate reductase